MRTGPDFHEDHILADGRKVTLRHVRPDDAAGIREGLARLSAQSRYRRFLAPVSALSDEQLRYLTCVDGQDHVAIVAVVAGPQGDSGLGIARFVRLRDEPAVAEAAITVIDDAQGKGLGRLLALTLALAAVARGVRRFRGTILPGNTAVLQLLKELGAVVKTGELGTVFEIELTPTPFEPGTGLDVIARRLLRTAARTAGVFRRATGE